MILRKLKTPTFTTILGLAGVIPFIFLTIMIVLGAEPLLAEYIFCLITYGAVILSFLGGIIWGQMVGSFSLENENLNLQKYLLISIMAALLSWTSLLISPKNGLVLLGICFSFLIFVEKKLKKIKIIPAWYFKLRKFLTILVGLSLLVSFISISFSK